MDTFRNENNAKQLVDFSGMRRGKKAPTDIDEFYDHGGRAFMYFEAKYGDTELNEGQRLALEHACKSHRHPSIAVIFSHTTPNHLKIDMAVCPVTHIYFRGKWITPKKPVTVSEIYDWFIRTH